MAVPDLSREPPGPGLRRHWALEPGIRFLNHGSFGATPRAVLAAQGRWREHMERQPVRFMGGELPGLLRGAAGELADFLGAPGEGLAFTENATASVNAVLRSIGLRPGDEVLCSRHAYPGVKNALRHRCHEAGAALQEAAVPFPCADDDEVVGAYDAAIGPATRLVVVDHVSAFTAVIQPVARLTALGRGRGVPVLVDGAHAAGMLDLRLGELDADWYAGNCHKWLLAPKGSGFLWAAPRAREGLRPAVISNRWGQGFPAEFDWAGTRDPSAWLATTEAIAFLRSLGVARYREYIHALALEAAALIGAAWKVGLPAPGDLLGAMATLPLPEALQGRAAAGLHDALWERWRVEVPVLEIDGRLWARISGQVYNELADYAALAEAVTELAR
ncbi:MAG TPA: aminotransferase class V-fold PLP-dependent enzyme [Burkholderiales bacterium]|nr:aminotransferase class V-fold PLP-dependent enzyme [Burkholderiales bacterium]